MIITDVIILIKEFEGIIGALLGVIVTMVLTKIFQNAGKVKSYIEEVNFTFDKQNEFGGMEEVVDAEEAEYGSLTFSMQMHNSSETLKALRSFKIVFLNENKELLFSIIPKDEATRRFAAAQHFRDDLSIANISPKQIVRYDIFSSLSEQQCKSVKDCKYVFLEYHETNNKRRRNLMYTF